MIAIEIRKGELSDGEWLLPLYQQCVDGGHFQDPTGSLRQAQNLFGSSIVHGYLEMKKVRQHRIVQRKIQVEMWVASVQGNPAGFLLCLHDDDGYELHLAGTRPEYRGQGCFTALITYAIGRAPSRSRVFARCYTSSVKAIAIFKRKGFIVTKFGSPIELTLKSHPDPAVHIENAAVSPEATEESLSQDVPTADAPAPVGWWSKVRGWFRGGGSAARGR